MTPFFSIVIPCKNRSRLLLRAMLSLRAQKYRNFEVLVVDDGSSEDLAKMIQISGQSARLLQGGGLGGNHARNVGTDAAVGKFICYLDSDDIFLPQKLDVYWRILEGQEVDGLVTRGFVWRGSERIYVKPVLPRRRDEDISDYYFVSDQRYLTSSICVKAEAAQAVRWDEELKKVQDPDFVIRFERSGYNMLFSPEIQTVLFDDNQDGRLTRSNYESNMRDWIGRSGSFLTPSARSSFVHSALAYEVGLSRPISGLTLALAGIFVKGVPFKLALKTAYRVLVSEERLKDTAQRIAKKNTLRRPDVANFIRDLEANCDKLLSQT